jgi:hypothetical protein
LVRLVVFVARRGMVGLDWTGLDWLDGLDETTPATGKLVGRLDSLTRLASCKWEWEKASAGYHHLPKRGGVWQVVVEIDADRANNSPTSLNTTRQHVSFFFFFRSDLLCLILPLLPTTLCIPTYLPRCTHLPTHSLTHATPRHPVPMSTPMPMPMPCL